MRLLVRPEAAATPMYRSRSACSPPQNPIMTYTVHSVAWMADKCRNLTARQKAVIMRYPRLQRDYRLPQNQLVSLTINILRRRQRLSVEVSIYHR